MFKIEDFKRIGRIIRTHGNSGEIIIRTEINIEDILEGMNYLFIDVNGLIPYRITEFSIRNKENIQLSLLNLTTVELADRLTGRDVFIENSLFKNNDEILPSEIELNEFTVYDKTYGKIGQISDLILINNNPLLRIYNGKEEILIPFNEDFIENTDYERKIILMDLPEGLLSINS